jgi:hypothetical protein
MGGDLEEEKVLLLLPILVMVECQMRRLKCSSKPILVVGKISGTKHQNIFKNQVR